METVAGKGYSVIRYIEAFQLDLGIGTGGDKPYPEIRFLFMSEIESEIPLEATGYSHTLEK
jgi:hypothetical protein